ncbi:MAG: thioredoxin [Bacteroidota bacterium]
MTQHFTDANFAEEVLNSKIPVLVDFFAVWCGPCKAMAPTIDELAVEYEGKVKIGKMDVDENPITAQKYGIMSIPTITFFKNGEAVDSTVGVKSKDTLAEKLDGLL